jgi:hypothetical protein
MTFKNRPRVSNLIPQFQFPYWGSIFVYYTVDYPEYFEISLVLPLCFVSSDICLGFDCF